MDSASLLAGLGVGVILGAMIGFLYARNRLTSATVDLTAQARAADERARAAQEQAALVDGYLAERFQALSTQALDASQRRLLEVSEIRLRAANLSAASELDSRRNAVEQLVEPLRQTRGSDSGHGRDKRLDRSGDPDPPRAHRADHIRTGVADQHIVAVAGQSGGDRAADRSAT